MKKTTNFTYIRIRFLYVKLSQTMYWFSIGNLYTRQERTERDRHIYRKLSQILVSFGTNGFSNKLIVNHSANFSKYRKGKSKSVRVPKSKTKQRNLRPIDLLKSSLISLANPSRGPSLSRGKTQLSGQGRWKKKNHIFVSRQCQDSTLPLQGDCHCRHGIFHRCL